MNSKRFICLCAVYCLLFATFQIFFCFMHTIYYRLFLCTPAHLSAWAQKKSNGFVLSFCSLRFKILRRLLLRKKRACNVKHRSITMFEILHVTVLVLNMRKWMKIFNRKTKSWVPPFFSTHCRILPTYVYTIVYTFWYIHIRHFKMRKHVARDMPRIFYSQNPNKWTMMEIFGKIGFIRSYLFWKWGLVDLQDAAELLPGWSQNRVKPDLVHPVGPLKLTPRNENDWILLNQEKFVQIRKTHQFGLYS